MNRLLYQLKVQQQELEREILATPSGERRNMLTEANIHLLAAIDVISKAK